MNLPLQNSTYVVSETYLLQGNSINNQPWHSQMVAQEVGVTEIHFFSTASISEFFQSPQICHVSHFPKQS